MDFICTLEEMAILYLQNRPLLLYKAQQIIDLVECKLKIIANLQRRGFLFHNTKTSNVAEWKSVFLKNFSNFLETTNKQNLSYKIFKDKCDTLIREISAETSKLADLDEKL